MATLNRELIDDYLLENKEAIIDSLQELVRAESPSIHQLSQVKILNILADHLMQLDYKTVLVPGKKTGGYLYARSKIRPCNLPLQLLIGHCDTVWPVNTLNTMPLQREDNKMSGPGIYDMKAGLVQILYALKAMKDLAIPTAVFPIVLINSDEEIGSRESKHMITRLARLADRALILEPSLGPKGKLKTARKGVARFTITVRGKAAHAGLDPGKGASAIVELSHTIQKLFAMNDPRKEISVNVGLIEGGIGANVVAPESKAVVDVRVPRERDAKRITQMIHALKPHNPEVTLEIEGQFGRPPMESTPGNRKIWQLAQRVGAKLGLQLEEAMAGGGSDGNYTSPFTPTLDGLGAVGEGAHADHEFIFIDRIIERTELLIYLMAAGPIKNT